MAKLKASSLQDVEENREVEGHWDLLKEVVDKKELEDCILEIQQRFLNHQPGAKQKRPNLRSHQDRSSDTG